MRLRVQVLLSFIAVFSGSQTLATGKGYLKFVLTVIKSKKDMLIYRVPNEKVNINETNWTPNQYTDYPDLYIKTAKQAAPNPYFSGKRFLKCFLLMGGAIFLFFFIVAQRQ